MSANRQTCPKCKTNGTHENVGYSLTELSYQCHTCRHYFEVPRENKILMPKELTAENGAKGLLIGEFFESLDVDCDVCCGTGEDFTNHDCSDCQGEGHESIQVPVSWTTIKEIYAMAVKHFSNLEDEDFSTTP